MSMILLIGNQQSNHYEEANILLTSLFTLITVIHVIFSTET